MGKAEYELSMVQDVLHSLQREKNLIQIITGPRQVGKSTSAFQIGEKWTGTVRYASADTPVPPGPEWIRHQWQLARLAAEENPLLVIDEVQKAAGWSEEVKSLWDEDRRIGKDIRVLLLGSSALLMQKGLSESLTGRFFLARPGPWLVPGKSPAFGVGLGEWVILGGYSGTVPF